MTLVTTHGCRHHPGDIVTVNIEGWTIPGTITKLSPFRIHVNMNGCKQAVKPAQVTAEVR